jgi:hypothetical protein
MVAPVLSFIHDAPHLWSYANKGTSLVLVVIDDIESCILSFKLINITTSTI